MKNLSYLILALLFSTHMQAQVSYDDVAVIINDNSPASIEIGNYFQQQRAIPDINMIHINTTTDEEIDDSTFESIRTQIEDYLTDNNLVNEINYLVTTKGVPLKVSRNDCTDPNTFHACASLDSELTLILSTDNDAIGEGNNQLNNYFEEEAHFSRAEYDMYLVTRLDGYATEDVINMIDRSGPQTIVNQLNSISVFDISYVFQLSTLSLFYNYFMSGAIDVISAAGWPNVYHPDTTILMNQQNVFGYVGVNYQPADAQLNYTWKKGSIADILFEGSANTFDVNNNTNNDLVIANLIAEGATGAHGYTYFTFTSSSMKDEILFDRYTNAIEDYNLAESYFMAIQRTSWQSVVVGDPKTSIVIDNTASAVSPDLERKVELFPNPSNGRFTIQTEQLEVSKISIFNQLGQVVLTCNPEVTKTAFEMDLSEQAAGVYYLEIETDEGTVGKKVVVKE